jgi:hypothetical protein
MLECEKRLWSKEVFGSWFESMDQNLMSFREFQTFKGAGMDAAMSNVFSGESGGPGCCCVTSSILVLLSI